MERSSSHRQFHLWWSYTAGARLLSFLRSTTKHGSEQTLNEIWQLKLLVWSRSFWNVIFPHIDFCFCCSWQNRLPSVKPISVRCTQHFQSFYSGRNNNTKGQMKLASTEIKLKDIFCRHKSPPAWMRVDPATRNKWWCLWVHRYHPLNWIQFSDTRVPACNICWGICLRKFCKIINHTIFSRGECCCLCFEAKNSESMNIGKKTFYQSREEMTGMWMESFQSLLLARTHHRLFRRMELGVWEVLMQVHQQWVFHLLQASIIVHWNRIRSR